MNAWIPADGPERTEFTTSDGAVIVTERSGNTITITVTQPCGCETRSSRTEMNHPFFPGYGSSSYTGSSCIRHQPRTYMANA